MHVLKKAPLGFLSPGGRNVGNREDTDAEKGRLAPLLTVVVVAEALCRNVAARRELSARENLLQVVEGIRLVVCRVAHEDPSALAKVAKAKRMVDYLFFSDLSPLLAEKDAEKNAEKNDTDAQKNDDAKEGGGDGEKEAKKARSKKRKGPMTVYAHASKNIGRSLRSIERITVATLEALAQHTFAGANASPLSATIAKVLKKVNTKLLARMEKTEKPPLKPAGSRKLAWLLSRRAAVLSGSASAGPRRAAASEAPRAAEALRHAASNEALEYLVPFAGAGGAAGAEAAAGVAHTWACALRLRREGAGLWKGMVERDDDDEGAMKTKQRKHDKKRDHKNTENIKDEGSKLSPPSVETTGRLLSSCLSLLTSSSSSTSSRNVETLATAVMDLLLEIVAGGGGKGKGSHSMLLGAHTFPCVLSTLSSLQQHFGGGGGTKLGGGGQVVDSKGEAVFDRLVFSATPREFSNLLQTSLNHLHQACQQMEELESTGSLDEGGELADKEAALGKRSAFLTDREWMEERAVGSAFLGSRWLHALVKKGTTKSRSSILHAHISSILHKISISSRIFSRLWIQRGAGGWGKSTGWVEAKAVVDRGIDVVGMVLTNTKGIELKGSHVSLALHVVTSLVPTLTVKHSARTRQHVHTLLMVACKPMLLLVKHRLSLLSRKLGGFTKHLLTMMRYIVSLWKRLSTDANPKKKKEYELSLECASALSRVMEDLGRRETVKLVNKYVPYLLHMYAQGAGALPLDARQRGAITPGVYALIAICTDVEFRQIFANLDEGGKAVFKKLLADYKKTHKFTGDV